MKVPLQHFLLLWIIQLGLELISLITPSYQIKILTGHTLYIVCQQNPS